MNHTDDIRRFLVTEYARDVNPDDLPDDYDLFTGGMVDSLGLLRLVSWIRDHFAIPVDDVDITPGNFRTIAAIEQFVAHHRGTVPSGDAPVHLAGGTQ